MFSCKNCKWYIKDNHQITSGECRKNAPISILNPKGELSAAWPFVSETDFCGSHMIDITREAIKEANDEELKQELSQMIEKNITAVSWDRDDNFKHIVGKIILDGDPSESDREIIEQYLSTAYEYVDIAIIKER